VIGEVVFALQNLPTYGQRWRYRRLLKARSS
jgi:hypothetical protein